MSEVLVDVKNLKKYFPTGEKGKTVKAVDDISFQIYKGETLVDKYVTDENGQFTTKEYVCDTDWTIREITPPCTAFVGAYGRHGYI